MLKLSTEPGGSGTHFYTTTLPPPPDPVSEFLLLSTILPLANLDTPVSTNPKVNYFTLTEIKKMRRTESDQFCTPDLSIDDPDWETFEEVEAYASQGRVGLLARVLPEWVWDYWFAPTTATPETIESDRTEVVIRYRAVVDVAEDALDRLAADGSEDSLDQTKWTTERLNKIDQHRFPASSRPLNDHDSFAAYLNEVATALARERTAVETSVRLLTEPAASFLREAERDRIQAAQTLLEHSVKQGRARCHAVARERREVITLLNQRLPQLKADLDQAAVQAQPYLNLELYLDTDDTLDTLESVNEALSTLQKTHRIELLSHPLSDKIERMGNRVVSLRENLTDSRREYAELQLEELHETVKTEIEDLRVRLRGAREDGEVIRSPTEIFTRTDDLRCEIQDFCAAPWRHELPPGDLSELSKYESQLDTIELFVEEKVRFDTQYKTYTDQFRDLRADATPYLEYEWYLTRPTRQDLVARLANLTETVEELAAKTRFDRLSQTDRARCTDLEETIAAIEKHLEDYNPSFIRRQREACAEFFTDIGPGNLDLTAEQQRAVIRNGIYNQVIAAAGTGKTLTLTTRVAYLVRVQDIPPNRILVVTFTNSAAQEMRERLDDHFGITDVEVKTLNSFGNGIIEEASDDHVDTIDPKEKQHVIDQEIQSPREAEDSEFLRHYYQFLTHFENEYLEEVDFETKEDYVEARRDANYVTLGGNPVKSRAEKVIADFLYTHRVRYQYEARATWADSAADKAGYTPDFYLPEYDTYIEHWGIDETGSVAPWFSLSSQEYRDDMLWKRQQFASTEYDLVGTYQFEYDANRLESALRHRLQHHGVGLDRIPFDELIETVFESDRKEKRIKDQFEKFVENAKRFDVTNEEIESKLQSANPRQYHFGKCGTHIRKQYEDYLTRNQLIDFIDQIKDALSLVENEPVRYQSQYDHLLVDEFQDIGVGKLELIQALAGPDGAKLFAVGDDWQSIYSFQGASVDQFTCFEDYFGDPVRTDLTANFRSPSSIVEMGNHLIQYNSERLEKTVRATVDIRTTPQIHTLRGYRGKFYDYVRRVRRYAVGLVEEYLAAGANPSDIMILCRYDEARPYLEKIKCGLRSREIPYTGKDEGDQYRGPNGRGDCVPVYSIHQAKGREADHVILVHVADGFPKNDRGNELLDPVQPLNLGGLEEERRLFYVAVTRTERSLDLLTRAEQESQFLGEISKYTTSVDSGQVQPLEEVGKQMSVEVQVKELSDPWTKQHQRGKLCDKYGGIAQFISWVSDLPPTLEQGEWYWIKNALVDEYKGQKELVITDTTTVKRLPEGPTDPETAAIDGLDRSG